MDDNDLLRYSRQIMLPAFGIEGQEALHAARVLVVGLGGLGSPVAMYLAAAGVGTLVLADFDRVELTNLQRQILHTSDRIGLPKVDSARRGLAALNPHVRIEGYSGRVDEDSLPELVAGADVVVDGCDNFATRFAVNLACMRGGVPLVSGAAIRTEGQVAVFPSKPGGPCYRCLYPGTGEEDTACAANGVLGPVVGIVGSIQAMEVIKLITGLGEPLSGRLLLIDAMSMAFRSVRITPDPLCPVCARERGSGKAAAESG